MSILSLLFRTVVGSKKLPTVIGVLTVDVTLSEEHSFEAQATEWPVETGAVITDHVHLKGRRLTIEGFVSDTPLDTWLLPDLGRGRSASALFYLEYIWRARIPFTVVSQLLIYRNMVIENIRVPKARESGIRFTVEMREIELVTSVSSTLPATTNEGLKSSQSATAANGGGTGALNSGNVSPENANTINAGRQAGKPYDSMLWRFKESGGGGIMDMLRGDPGDMVLN